MNTFTRAIALILTVLMVAILPLRYMAINQTAIINSMVDQETKEFADDIMTQGHLSLDMYNGFIDKLSITDQLYDIDLIHSKSKHSHDVAEYNQQEEIKGINYDIVKGRENNSQTSPIKTLAKSNDGYFHLDSKNNNGFRQMSSNILEESSISSFATHTHTDDCYAGHRHNINCNYVYNVPAEGISGFFRRADGTLREVYSTAELGGRFESNRLILVDNHETGVFSITEYRGGSIYYYKELTYGSGYYGDPVYISARQQLHTYLIIVENRVGYMNPNYGYGIYVNPGQFPQFTVSSCSLAQDETPICNQVVTSITPTNPTQTVDKGATIITTANATYLDGHTGIVNCTSNFNANIIGTQNVTLTYSGKVTNAKTTGTLSCNMSVTVRDNYIPKELKVTPSSYTVYNGSEPSYTVEVIYENGTKKVVTSGYAKTGFTVGAGTKEVNFTYTENNKTVTAKIIITVKRNVKTCVKGHTYELDDFDTDLGCPVCNQTIDSIIVSPDTLTVGKGSSLAIKVTARYQDNHTVNINSGWTSNFDNSKVGVQNVTITYMGKTALITVTVEDKTICPICGLAYIKNELNPGCPTCSKKVVSITATPVNQMVPVSGEMVVEVEALYQDGHKALVTDWISDFNPFRSGTQKVNITYESVSTTITVIIDSGTDVTCPICGTTYSLATNPNGCPVCSVKIDHIEARLRSEGTKVQLGSELNLYIISVFKDGHKEKAYSDWEVEGFHPDNLGQQTLTVKYKGFVTTLNIEIINTLNKVTCPNGHVYYLNEDGSDPGCPYCNIDDIPGLTTDYFECVYTVEIIEILYEEGNYQLEKGDLFTVEVHKKTSSVYDRLKNFWNTEHAYTKKFTYGGMINN